MTRARDVANLIGSGNYSSTTFTATAGQTVFSIAHTQNFVQVFMNGLLLDLTVDYTSNGSAVTLTSGAAAGDEIEVVAYNTFSVGDALNQAAADTRYVNTTGDTMSGGLTVNSSDNVNISRGASHGNNYEGGRLTLKNGSGITKQYGLDTYYENFRIFREDSDGSNGVVRLEIDSNGYVTTPNQPAFLAYGMSGSTNTNGSYWIFPNVTINQGNCYSNSTGRFTAPVNGNYMFFATFIGNNTNDVYRYKLRKNLGNYPNNSTQIRLDTGATGTEYEYGTMAILMTMNTGDYASIHFESQGTDSHSSSTSGHEMFSGYLIG